MPLPFYNSSRMWIGSGFHGFTLTSQFKEGRCEIKWVIQKEPKLELKLAVLAHLASYTRPLSKRDLCVPCNDVIHLIYSKPQKNNTDFGKALNINKTLYFQLGEIPLGG